MNTLIIDTSSHHEIISIRSSNSEYSMSKNVELSHSITLFDNLKSCLQKAEISMNDIELVGVGIGPGSFTGVRIAVTTARMIAQLLRVPLVGIKTHLLYASSVKCSDSENILVAFDAKKNRVFGALYKKVKETTEEIIAPGDYGIEHLINKIDKNKTHAIGDGIEKYDREINKQINNINYIKEIKIDAQIAGQLIIDLYKTDKEKHSNINNTVPYYARKSDAEVMKEKKALQ